MVEFRVANDTLEDGRAVFVTIMGPGGRIAANVEWGRLRKSEAGTFETTDVTEALRIAQQVAIDDERPYVAVTLEGGARWDKVWGDLKD